MNNIFNLPLHAHYVAECRDHLGQLKWTEDIHNLITRVGGAQILTDTFKASSYTASWYIGLVKTSDTFATTDTMASHSGWSESASYSNSNRPAFTPGSVSSSTDTVSVDNSASVAVFNINATDTILGCFMVDNSTISGTSGNLYGAAAFGSSRSVASGDTLSITATLTVSAG